MASSIFFSVMALPICTAWLNSVLWPCSTSALEKVAPWMPSRPVRPPMATMRSPRRVSPFTMVRGITPITPQ